MDRLVVVGARQHNLQERQRLAAARQARRLHRAERLGQVVARVRHDLRRGPAPLRRVALAPTRGSSSSSSPSPTSSASTGSRPPSPSSSARSRSRPRSTVGTVTEIADYLRLLFARVGIPHCPNCGKRIEAQTVQQIVDRILALPRGRALQRRSRPSRRARKGELKLELERLRREGFVRARVDGAVVDLGDEIELDRTQAARPRRRRRSHRPQGGREGPPHRQRRARAQARRGPPARRRRGRGAVLAVASASPASTAASRCRRSSRACSRSTARTARAPPATASARARVVDPERVVGDPRAHAARRRGRSRGAGAARVALATELARAVEALGVDPDVAVGEAPRGDEAGASSSATGRAATPPSATAKRAQDARQQEAPTKASSRASRRASTTRRAPVAERRRRSRRRRGRDRRRRARALPRHAHLRRLQGPAPASRGARGEARRARTSPSSARMPLATAARVPRRRSAAPTTPEQPFSPRERAIAEPLLRAVTARLGFLIDVGLDYLSLDRSAQTLSSGEGQRIRLATQIGAALVGVLYVLDEPSVGLHARDNARLIEAQARLRDLGNTRLRRRARSRGDPRRRSRRRHGPRRGRPRRQDRRRRARPPSSWTNPASITGPWLSGKKQLPIPTQAQEPRRRRASASSARARTTCKNVTRRDPDRPLHVRHRRLRQRQVEPRSSTRSCPPRAPSSTRATAPIGECDARRGPRAHRQGHLDRPGADRPHAALEPGDVHRRLRAPPRALRRPARGARARLQGRAASRST